MLDLFKNPDEGLVRKQLIQNWMCAKSDTKLSDHGRIMSSVCPSFHPSSPLIEVLVIVRMLDGITLPTVLGEAS